MLYATLPNIGSQPKSGLLTHVIGYTNGLVSNRAGQYTAIHTARYGTRYTISVSRYAAIYARGGRDSNHAIFVKL